ncbi:Nuclear architecture-related protein 1 [Intoshia linei]|uniref:Nuclear architecture-related protein 1 n=1 Tax=Intoshia linei TaxID=1819745 RepID=A0A177B492_9BILA|nr:Nuclear architecture-related protein 1 [Intoshia linei]
MDFSIGSTIKLSDINDFTTATNICIKPEKLQKSKESIKLDKKFKISLSDCLSCNGCISSVETSLISQQDFESMVDSLQKCRNRKKIMILSYQSLSAVARVYNMDTKTISKYIADMFYKLAISLHAAALEFAEKVSKNSPYICSSCPGIVRYIENVYPSYVTYLSTVKSPQQIQSSLLRSCIFKNENLYIATLMPCHDRKLESSQTKFLSNNNSKDIDCVVSTSDLLTYIKKTKLSSNVGKIFTPFLQETEIEPYIGLGSDGFLQHSFVHTEQKFDLNIKYDQIKNGLANLNVKGSKYLYTYAYGYKNIQYIIQKLKKPKQNLQYIELMACDEGCLNGAGQFTTIQERDNSLPDMKNEQNDTSYNYEKIVNSYEKLKSTVPNKTFKKIVYTNFNSVTVNSTDLTIEW